MKTEVLTIKRELPATRCDICHQADCFTPETNVCTRCAGISVAAGASLPVMRRPLFSSLLTTGTHWDRESLASAFSGIPLLNRTSVYYLLSALPFVGVTIGSLVFRSIEWLGGMIFVAVFLESLACLVWGSFELVRNGISETDDWPALALAGFGGTFFFVTLAIYVLSRAFI